MEQASAETAQEVGFYSSLESAFHPLVILTNDKVEWHNSAATALFGPTCELVIGVLSNAELALLYKRAQTVKIIEIETPTGPLTLQVRVLDLSTGSPDSERWLLQFQPPDRAGIRHAGQEQEWFAAAAHDLKNPLGAVFGYADTLLDTPVGASLEPKQRQLVARIRAAGHRSLELLRNVQLLSMLEGRQVLTQGEPVDLNQIIRTVVDSTWREDPSTPIVKQNLTEDQLSVNIPKLDLERIIANLFSNALKFAEKGSCVTITSRSEKRLAICEIENWGTPIAESELPGLFQRFSRLSNSRNTPGSGLGLFIVKSLITRANGDIEVSSSVEGRTKFSIRLPVFGR